MSVDTSRPPTLTDVYHMHLDQCKRCRENPMDQCPAGLAALRAAASGNPDELTNIIPERPSAFDLVGELEGRSAEEIAVMKDIAVKVLGPWVNLL